MRESEREREREGEKERESHREKLTNQSRKRMNILRINPTVRNAIITRKYCYYHAYVLVS